MAASIAEFQPMPTRLLLGFGQLAVALGLVAWALVHVAIAERLNAPTLRKYSFFLLGILLAVELLLVLHLAIAHVFRGEPFFGMAGTLLAVLLSVCPAAYYLFLCNRTLDALRPGPFDAA